MIRQSFCYLEQKYDVSDIAIKRAKIYKESHNLNKQCANTHHCNNEISNIVHLLVDYNFNNRCTYNKPIKLT